MHPTVHSYSIVSLITRCSIRVARVEQNDVVSAESARMICYGRFASIPASIAPFDGLTGKNMGCTMTEKLTEKFRTAVSIVIAVLLTAIAIPAFAARQVGELHGANEQLMRGGDIDGDTAVLGFDLGLSPSTRGRAFVFERVAGSWDAPPTELVPNIRIDDDGFGTGVAIDGDTAIVGAWRDSEVNENSGALYVFVRESDGWRQQAKLLPDSASPIGLGFGYGADIDGDTIAVATHSESIYVFERQGGTWSLAKVLSVPYLASGIWFDIGINFGAVDVDGDRIAIGNESGNGSGGEVVIFERQADGSWPQTGESISVTGSPGLWFGTSIDLDGNYLLAGADGHAFVFRNEGGDWLKQWEFEAAERFRNVVALDGPTALIDVNNNVYHFERQGDEWLMRDVMLKASTSNVDDRLSLSGSTALIDDRWTTYQSSIAVFDIEARALLECSNDVNGDGSPDLAVVRPDGRVTVRSVGGDLINEFSTSPDFAPAATVLLSDSNANGAADLAIRSRSGESADVFDLLTGASLGQATFAGGRDPADLESLGDTKGNGADELALLADSPVSVQLRDSLSNESVGDIDFRRYIVPVDLEPLAGGTQLAVLGENKTRSKSDKIEVRSASSGAELRSLWLGRDWAVVAQRLVADINGNGQPELAVLRTNARGRVSALIVDSATGATLNWIGFASRWKAQALLVIPDFNGNGADEILVFGRRDDGFNQRADVRDSATGARLGVIWFNRSFPAEAITTCPDVNGNGSADVALLGRHADGRLRVMVMDGRNTDRISSVDF